jgi:hypothetical protein
VFVKYQFVDPSGSAFVVVPPIKVANEEVARSEVKYRLFPSARFEVDLVAR